RRCGQDAHQRHSVVEDYQFGALQEHNPKIVIPVSQPLLDERALSYVEEAVRTGWISSEGRFIAEFERRWAEYCGVTHGVAVCNGTVALELAMAALALPAGSE